ncbi:uncharacterized protein LOC133199106 [Saccostrea echinata]|uniref:uncharacterized protein LOC133199106 n=2 Tax=Saccostrea echinata TaxID=191078 RepID=UPI002A7F5B3F|nr:uncharacterized protein LOC133199106 [Saccostrea echinata]
MVKPKYRRHGFVSKTKKERYEKVSAGQLTRWIRGAILRDHNYSASATPVNIDHDQELPNLNILEREEVVDGGEVTTSEDWKEGRRVVELGVLAEGLRGCCKCGLPLQLSHTISVLTHGLASLLKVCCSNTKCNHINHVKTGKKHGKVWDVNTKLSAAMVHVGIGVTQVNSLLSELNIPPVSHAMLDNRQKEIGRAVQDIAAESMSNALQKELGMMNEEMNEKGLVVAVDAGWQKRGSGKTYDSLSGHCSMVGPLSGKVLSYSVRSKNCRVCSVAETTNKNPAAHECSKNWEGSSKAMEADMVIEMVEDLQKSKGITIDGIIGDEDTTTIARLKTNVNANIKKLSDKNHLKKLFTNSLFTLKKEHSSLTLSVIKYIQKCFSYSIAQGKGNALQIQEDLSSIPYHIFGDHEHCSARWCKFIDNPNLRYKSLPHGKPLKDRFLQDDLKEVFSSYASHSDRLSCLGSTQSNESFNRMVSAKAPKTHHYSSSSSLRYRVAACVAQKNEGHRYLIKVNKKLGLSPGYYTRRQCILRDLQRKRQKAISMTQKFKRRRRELKAKRIQSLSTKETREGVSYLTGCDLHHASDIDEIPAPKTIPKYDHLPSSQLLNAEEIYFDLETTGLARDSHIVQLSAVRNDEVFNKYIIPKKPMTSKATEITGIQVVNNKMYHNHEEVETVSIKDALIQFMDFMKMSGPDVVLVGHNSKVFDLPVLFNILSKLNILETFSSAVTGFIDTIPLFKMSHPNLSSYSQLHLFAEILQDKYSAHDSLQDVIALKRLVDHTGPSHEVKVAASFTLNSAVAVFHHKNTTKHLMSTLRPLLDQKVISNGMGNKIAGSGLSLSHLQLAYQRNGREGVQDVLSEIADNSVRVTKSKKIIDSVADYFRSEQ